MKKGLKSLIFVVFSSILMLISLGIVVAPTCPVDNVFTSTECVCGHSPNSALGYGQVVIGGAVPAVISCKNVEDGACPEDFMDAASGLIGNCGSCPDPDCTVAGLGNTGAVYGYVRDAYNRPIQNAVVTGHPIKWDNNAILERNTTTNFQGLFNFSEFITGEYYFSATKDSYDVQLKEAAVNRGEITRIDFILQNGTCHEDCTNSYNRCNSACEGMSFAGGGSCHFYDLAVRMACDNRMEGTLVRLDGYPGTNSTHAYFVDCCEGIPYSKYYASVNSTVSGVGSSGAIKNLIKIEKIAKYNDVPVRIIIAYWQ